MIAAVFIATHVVAYADRAAGEQEHLKHRNTERIRYSSDLGPFF